MTRLPLSSHVRHLADRQPQRERRHRHDRRPRQHARERRGELGVRHRMRRGHVDRPPDRLGLQRMMERAHRIVDRHPVHRLLAGAQPAAASELEDRQHGRERAARGREHGAQPQVADANAGAHRRRGRGLPLLTDLRQEAVSRADPLRSPRRAAGRRSRRPRRRAARRAAPAASRAIRRGAACRRRGCGRMRSLRAAVHRPAPTFSPARWMTASRPSAPSGRRGQAFGIDDPVARRPLHLVVRFRRAGGPGESPRGRRS